MPDQDPETWMWERARALLEEAERVQRRFFQPGRSPQRGTSWEPPVDIYATADELLIQIALPGVRAERLHVEIEGEVLVVHGVRALPAAFHRAQVHRLEIPHGRFERRIPLPGGAYELRRSELDRGCLFLNLRRIDR